MERDRYSRRNAMHFRVQSKNQKTNWINLISTVISSPFTSVKTFICFTSFPLRQWTTENEKVEMKFVELFSRFALVDVTNDVCTLRWVSIAIAMYFLYIWNDMLWSVIFTCVCIYTSMPLSSPNVGLHIIYHHTTTMASQCQAIQSKWITAIKSPLQTKYCNANAAIIIPTKKYGFDSAIPDEQCTKKFLTKWGKLGDGSGWKQVEETDARITRILPCCFNIPVRVK